MNILFSTICFVNRKKPGAEIYATFAKRLVNDVMTKTPCDMIVTTNEPFQFDDEVKEWGDRVIVRDEPLDVHHLTVGVFNQLLKFYSVKDIDSKYDWVIYTDCDAGVESNWDLNVVDEAIKNWESKGYDMLATRTNCSIKGELLQYKKWEEEHLAEIANGNVNHFYEGGLFSKKFKFYNVTLENGPFEWFEAIMPSEHVFMIKNNEKLPIFCKIFEDFCFQFESQLETGIINVDMEAFEIGVSALMSGYNMGEFDNHGIHYVTKVLCNFNNWERVKL